MSVLLVILCWRYFSYLKMYLEQFFNGYFYELMLFEILAVKGDTT